MGSTVSIINDTNQDWVCSFALLGGGRPAGGRKTTKLKGNEWQSITAEFTLGLPILVCMHPPEDEKAEISTKVHSPGSFNQVNTVYVSDFVKTYGKKISQDNIDALKVYYPEDFPFLKEISVEQVLNEISRQQPQFFHPLNLDEIVDKDLVEEFIQCIKCQRIPIHQEACVRCKQILCRACQSNIAECPSDHCKPLSFANLQVCEQNWDERLFKEQILEAKSRHRCQGPTQHYNLQELYNHLQNEDCPFQRFCNSCNFQFDSYTLYFQHVELHCPNVRVYCEKCKNHYTRSTSDHICEGISEIILNNNQQYEIKEISFKQISGLLLNTGLACQESIVAVAGQWSSNIQKEDQDLNEYYENDQEEEWVSLQNQKAEENQQIDVWKCPTCKFLNDLDSPVCGGIGTNGDQDCDVNLGYIEDLNECVFELSVEEYQQYQQAKNFIPSKDINWQVVEDPIKEESQAAKKVEPDGEISQVKKVEEEQKEPYVVQQLEPVEVQPQIPLNPKEILKGYKMMRNHQEIIVFHINLTPLQFWDQYLSNEAKKWFADFQKWKGDKNITESSWQDVSASTYKGAKSTREFSMDLQLEGNAFFKEIPSIKQVHLLEKTDKLIRLINLGKTPTITYGDTLSLEEEVLCIQCPDNKTSLIRATSGIIWHKSTIMKGLIKTNCLKEGKASWQKYREWVENVNNDMV